MASKTFQPKMVPEPKSSLKNATITKIIPYPKELPTPSRKDGQGLLAIENASKRPIIIQLVIIKPTNTESCLLTS